MFSLLADVMFKVTEYVMLFAPIGVFAAISCTMEKLEYGILAIYAILIGVLYLAFFCIYFCSFCALQNWQNIFYGFVEGFQEHALLAFSTASSDAAFTKKQ
jgi:Na+/H+-dicarboxylate symporter